MSLSALRESIVEIGSRLWQQGYLPAFSGNISVMLSENSYLITPSTVCKGFLAPHQILLIDRNAKVLNGDGVVSGESALHLAAYYIRNDVKAIIHAHAPYSTALSCTNHTLPDDIVAELMLKIGHVPTVPFAPPCTEQLANISKPYIIKHNGLLLQNHGSVAFGTTLDEAFMRIELIEHAAKVFCISSALESKL